MKSRLLVSFALLICVLSSASWGQKQHSHTSRATHSHPKHTHPKHSAAKSVKDVSLRGISAFPGDQTWTPSQERAFKEKLDADERRSREGTVMRMVGIFIGPLVLYAAYYFIGRSLSDLRLRKAMKKLDEIEMKARLDPSSVCSFDFEYYDKRRDEYTTRTFVSEGAARKKEEEQRRAQSDREASLRARQLKTVQNIPAPPKAPPVSRHLSDRDIAKIVSTNAPIIAAMPAYQQEKSLQDWHQSNVSHYGPLLAQEILTKVRANLAGSSSPFSLFDP